MLELSQATKRIKRKKSKKLVLGWIGRVSTDKNFMQAIDIFCGVSKELKFRRVKMLVLGPVFNDKLRQEQIKRYIKAQNGNPKDYYHVGNGSFVSHKIKFKAWNEIDIFLFPSLANHESLGRTLLEANYFSLPVVAVNHGATSSIISKKNLLKPIYFNKEFDLNNVESLGKINIEEAVEIIVNNKLEINNFSERYRYHDKKLIDIINRSEEKKQELCPEVIKFINNIRVYTQSDSNFQLQDFYEKVFQFIKKEKKINISDTISRLMVDFGYKIYSKIKQDSY